MSLSRTAMRQMPSMVWYGRLTEGAPEFSMTTLIHAWTSARVTVPIRRSAQRSSQWSLHASVALIRVVSFQNGHFSFSHCS